MTDKLWGGRFTETGSDRVQAYGASIAADQYMIAEDIQASIAHAQMLGQQAIITAAEAAQIVAGLQAVRADFESGVATLQIAQEDVHMNVEVLLTEKIGPVAGKLHTARSRNTTPKRGTLRAARNGLRRSCSSTSGATAITGARRAASPDRKSVV